MAHRASVPVGFISRRIFVRGLGGLAAGTALPWTACKVAPNAPLEHAGAGTQATTGAACPPFLTPVEDFYRQYGGRTTVKDWALPDLDASHTLSISGLVGTELSLTLGDLEADDGHVTVVKTMICVLGYRSAAIWTGVPLRTLLDRAGIDRAHAVRVRFFGADGFENNLRMQDIYDAPPDLFDPLVAFQIYGQPLPRELGFPFRLLLGDRYGYKNTKWLARIEVTDSDEATGQYQAEGYPDAGIIDPVAIVDNLRLTETVPAGPVELCGYALSGYAGIDRVEYAIDGSAFTAARLASAAELAAEFPDLGASLQLDDPARYGYPWRGVWVAWRFTYDAKPGTHRVQLRVFDQSGQMAESTELHITAA